MRTPSFAAPAMLLFATIMLSGVASADKSCDPYFEHLRDYVKTHLGNRTVNVYWTTNYRSGHGGRFMGWTELHLWMKDPAPQDLAGSGVRRRKFDDFTRIGAQPVEERVSLRIRLDGKIVLSEQYGPYDPTCSPFSLSLNGQRSPLIGGYAVFHTGDSVEVLNFRPN